jgi:peptidoglycan/LPS O-acetylase OafA/YrhL
MPLKVGWHFVGFAAVYLANVSELFGVQLEYGPLWSLAVEEHFYIFWPWVVRWVRERGIAIAAIGVILLSPLVRAATFLIGGSWNGSVRTWNSLDGLAMGALLVLAARNEVEGRTTTRRIALVAAVFGVALLIVGIPHGIASETSSDMIGKALRTSTVNLFALSAVAGVLLVGTSGYDRFVNIKALQFLGFISYGFYLIHVLALHTYDAVVGRPTANLAALTFRAFIVFVATVGICWLSRVTFEQWFLERKEAALRKTKQLTAIAG